MRMRLNRMILTAVVLVSTAASARAASYKIEALKEAPPADLAGPIKDALNPEGYRVLQGSKPFADFWLRKSVPASGAPGSPKGAVLFPIFSEGELLGALRFHVEGGDYRGQPIIEGVYTLRYGLQPVNGAHLGVSTYRDYALLIQADKDSAVTDLPQQKLEDESAEAAESSHPAVLMLLAAPSPSAGAPKLVHDEEKDLWGAIVPLSLDVKGGAPATLDVQLIVVGQAMD